MRERRKDVRMPIYAQVEVSKPYLFSQGHARDISAGGIRIETQDALPEGSDVLVRLLLPNDTQPMELPGRVMCSQKGRWVGVAFYALPEDCRQRILDYLQQTLDKNVWAGTWQPPPIPPVRRSGRIHRRVPILLRWREPSGKTRQEAAETKTLSRHGALLLLYYPLQVGSIPLLRAPDRGDALCHVVYSAPEELQGRSSIALEFLGAENYWGMEFPPESVTLLPTRRRSARLEASTPLVLSWELDGGRQHAQRVESRDISRHGAGVWSFDAPWPMLERIIQVDDLQAGRRAAAYILWRGEKDGEGRLRLGLEFLGSDEFWGIPFDPDADYPEPPASRRTVE